MQIFTSYLLLDQLRLIQKYYINWNQNPNEQLTVISQGRSKRAAKWAKAAFQILAKSCVLVDSLSNEKRNIKTSSKPTIPCVKSCEFYSVT